jgi:hypothetical protein
MRIPVSSDIFNHFGKQYVKYRGKMQDFNPRYTNRGKEREVVMADHSPSPVAGSEKPARSFVSRFLRYTVGFLLLLLVVLVVGIYVWKTLAVRSLERQMEIQRSEMLVERDRALNAQAKDMLRLTALPLAWAVRSEMMRGNLDPVDDYFRELIRKPGVLLIALIDKEDKVVLATNRKLETQSAVGLFSKAIREADDIVIEDSESLLRMGVPIMSFNEKLGILVMEYHLQNPLASKLQP